MNIQQRTISHGPITIGFLVIDGECKTSADAGSIEQACSDLAIAGTVHVVVDASRMLYVSSLVIGKFVSLQTKLRDMGGKICIVNPRKNFREELKVTRLDKFLKVFETKEEAIKSFFETDRS